MTIEEIAGKTRNKAPHFFTNETLAFFHQSMDDFDVSRVEADIWRIKAPMRDFRGEFMGFTIRYFWKDDLYFTLGEAQLAQKGA